MPTTIDPNIDAGFQDRLAATEERVARLEGMLQELLDGRRPTPADELRARRIVVVDEEGFERIVLETLSTSGSVEVRGGKSGGERCVQLHVEDQVGEGDDGGNVAMAGLWVWIDGEEAIVLEADEHEKSGKVLPALTLGDVTLGKER